MRRREFGLKLAGAAFFLALVFVLTLMGFSGTRLTAQSDEAYPAAEATLTAAQMTAQPPLSPEYVFETTRNPGIPTLQVMVGDAATDAEALERILQYYNAHEQALGAIFDEANPDRLKALFSMYVVHISHIYGEQSVPTSLIEYLGVKYSHCGLYTRYQAEILDAFGLPWRIFNHLAMEHAWIEVPIDGRWEIFDSTVNVWVNTDGYALNEGAPRTYRTFYTPMNDIHRPDAREHYFRGPAANPRIGWYNMPRLRTWVPELGLSYTPETDPEDLMIHSSSPGVGSDRNQPWFDGLV